MISLQNGLVGASDTNGRCLPTTKRNRRMAFQESSLCSHPHQSRLFCCSLACDPGYFQGYLHRRGGRSIQLCVSKVGGSSPFSARHVSFSGKNSRRRQTFVSRQRSLSFYKRFLGYECLSRGAEHAHTTGSSSNTFICRMQDTQSSQREIEEAYWQREEKRWLREEERWLREESRWAAEREDLLEQTVSNREEIKALKQEIALLETQLKEKTSKDGTISELVTSLTRLLQSFDMATLGIEYQKSLFQAQIPSSLSSSTTDIGKALGNTPADMANKRIEKVNAVSQPSLLDLKAASMASSLSYSGSKRKLKRGTEGDDVKALQEALAKLGFYSGDDDMEHSTFSSGTERAVRSWQATLGVSEDGIVTEELLKRLLDEERSIAKEHGSSNFSLGEEATSGKTANPVSNTQVQAFNKKAETSDVKVKPLNSAVPERAPQLVDSSSPSKQSDSAYVPSRTRVYLLGENRWEEPDRLLSKNGPTSATAVSRSLNERCFACKGQGSMMCTECEGTGELNVEEQFLEWVDEGAKCPYCEGKGVLNCDVCDGTGLKASI